MINEMTDDELVKELTTPPFYSVALYKEDRKYGGPEEGGWWYDAGERIDFPIEGLEPETVLPRMFLSEDDAFDYARMINQQLDETVNKGRPSTGSVLSKGVFVAQVNDGYPPQFYPEQRPHYE